MSPNGSWKSWALGLASALVFATSGWAWHSATSELARMREIQVDRGERMARLEVEVAILKTAMERIEAKLDQALARKP